MPDHFTLLLEWRRSEAAARGLAKLPHDFYPATTAYLADVRRAYESELRENPSGRKGDISRQTYQRASQVARDIVEGRFQKTLTACFQASVGGARDLPNALPEERALFQTVLDALVETRRSAAPYLEPGTPSPPTGTAGVPTTAASSPPPGPSAASPRPGATARSAGLPPGPLTYVRILTDGRPVEVGTETIDLRTDDILSLPPEAARLLIEAKVAEPVGPASGRAVT